MIVQQIERERRVEVLKEQNRAFIQEKHQKAEKKSKEQKDKQDKIAKVYKDLEASHDLTDNLQELTQIIREFTGATGVYVGRLERPRVKIEDKDNDRAHVDREAQKEIRFSHATPEDHSYMVSKILKPNQGLSHKAFNAPVKQASEAVPEGGEPAEGEEGQKVAPKQEAAVDELMAYHYHIYVPDVVREQQMHFYRVPRLGAFFAVPLEYNSCLFEKALD